MATAEVGEFSTPASGGWAGPVAPGQGQLLLGGASCCQGVGLAAAGRGQLLLLGGASCEEVGGKQPDVGVWTSSRLVWEPLLCL